MLFLLFVIQAILRVKYTLSEFNMSTLHPEYTDDIFHLSIPVLAVDIVLFTLYKKQLCVVLVPGRNEWAD